MILLRGTIALIAAAAVLLVASAPASAAPCAGSGYGSAGAPGGSVPNDPLASQQWGLGQIRAPSAWSQGATGAGALIAIADTGVDLGHPDLSGHIAPGGSDFISGDGGDCPGPQDQNGHGTHVAGIAAAVTNNGVGVAGTAPDARILPVRVLDENGGGTNAEVAAGIRHAADSGADVINLSLGDFPILSQLPIHAEIEDAAAYAWSRGSLLVAAAGNEFGWPFCSQPAASANAICVAATDQDGNPPFYSNLPNDHNGGVGVRAPGGAGGGCEDVVDIWSTTWPQGAEIDCGSIKGYDTLSGTSMATPFVSGLAALLAGRGLTNQQIHDCIRDTSSNRGDFDPIMGYGIVDAATAVSTCTTAGGGFSGTTTGPAGRSGAGARDSRAPRIRIRLGRAKLRRLARTGKLRIRAYSSEAARVRMTALTGLARTAQRRKRSRSRLSRIAKRTTVFRRAGTRKLTLRISKSGRRKLARRRRATIVVVSRAKDGAGNSRTATARRTYRR